MTLGPPDAQLRPDEEGDDHVPGALVAREQRRHLRRILPAFLLVVVLLPLATLGGAWSAVLVPVLVLAAFAAREAWLLRRSVRRHGAVREP